MSRELIIVPMELRDANAFVLEHHRHHGACRGHKFSLGVVDRSGDLRGVAIVGRPVSRILDDGWTLEVNRLATDGVRNGCSALYGACWRAVRSLGYRRLITYILGTERGIGLKGAGWRCVGLTDGGSWNCKSRPRIDKHPVLPKMVWEIGDRGAAGPGSSSGIPFSGFSEKDMVDPDPDKI